MGRYGPRVPPITELRRDFGLDVRSVTPYSGGFESEGWVVDDQWFAKVWPADAPPVDIGLLDRLADAGLPVPRPLRPDGARSDDGRRYAVFPYVRGRHATGDDWAEVARTLRRVHDVPTPGLGLPTPPLTDAPLAELRPRLRHPWVADRAEELAAWLDRFEGVLQSARASQVPLGLSHDDFGGRNVLLDGRGAIVAILDWDWARLGPREHGLWLVIDEAYPQRFLDTYGSAELDLDPAHLEYGLLRRALGDLAARVVGEVDRSGISTWGFDRLARVDDTLAMFR
jgi:Phosphotransferase enzyme family